MSWSGGMAEWIDNDTAYLSVAFSWRAPEAYQRAVWYRAQGYKVRAGGPGLFALHKFMKPVAEIGGDVDVLPHHNPQATMASRGCPVGCYFCIVPAMEGKQFTLLPDFTPRPILCDNNLSALPVDYQEYIIEKYRRTGTRLLDCQEGFEPRTFDEDCYQRWKAINRGPWRLAYDETNEGEYVRRAMAIFKDEPSSDKRIYVLIGNEPMEDCYRRIMQVIEWGGEPHCQPLLALNTLVKRPKIRFDWTEGRLKDMARWANRWIWRTVPISEYKPRREAAPFAGVL